MTSSAAVAVDHDATDPPLEPLTGILGLVEVADLLGVKSATVYRWRVRNVLPEPDALLSGSPLWREGRIEQWARATGRPLAPGRRDESSSTTATTPPRTGSAARGAAALA